MNYKDLTPAKLAAYFDHTQLRAYAVEKDFEVLCEESKKYGFKMVALTLRRFHCVRNFWLAHRFM